MNTATDIARFLVQRYVDLRIPVTNMKLQKLLYFAWVEYHRDSGDCLFRDSVSAWKSGPVVEEVYMEYRKFMAMPIRFTEPPDNEMDGKTKAFLLDFADRYRTRSACDLVHETHRKGGPWERTFKEGRIEEIPFDLIVRLEHPKQPPGV